MHIVIDLMGDDDDTAIEAAQAEAKRLFDEQHAQREAWARYLELNEQVQPQLVPVTSEDVGVR